MAALQLHVDSCAPCLLNFVAQADQPVVQDHAPDQEVTIDNNHESHEGGREWIPEVEILVLVVLLGGAPAQLVGVYRVPFKRTFSPVPAATSKTLPSSTTTVPVRPSSPTATGDHRGHLGGIPPPTAS